MAQPNAWNGLAGGVYDVIVPETAEVVEVHHELLHLCRSVNPRQAFPHRGNLKVSFYSKVMCSESFLIVLCKHVSMRVYFHLMFFFLIEKTLFFYSVLMEVVF